MEFVGVKDIAIYGTNCVVDISRSDDDVCRFVSAREKHFSVELNKDGQLTITQKSPNILYMIIVRRLEFKLSVPRDFKGRIRFRNKNGGMYIKNVNCSDLDLSTKNGKYEIDKVTCNGLAVKMKNGTVGMKKLNAAQDVNIKCSNGNLKTEFVTASSFNISCNNAGLIANDVTVKKFDCNTSNGTIDINALNLSESARLDTSNGKITAVAVGKRDDFCLSLETTNGSISVDGTPCKNITDVTAQKPKLLCRTSNGDIDLKFM